MNQVKYASAPSFIDSPPKKITQKYEEIFYPESDGNPMADNTLQFHWIMTIEGNLESLFRDKDDVFVAGDLLWYPVEGCPEIRQAPDVLVAFGRPKGNRGSYKQWSEDNIPLQVVFEILSPGNRAGEMERKFTFYEQYGVEEYYIYDPGRGKLEGWMRNGKQLTTIAKMKGWVSPLLGIRFELVDGELELYHPTGKRFVGYVELTEQQEHERVLAEAQLVLAEGRADSAELRAEKERNERVLAEQRAEKERQRAEKERNERVLAEQRAEKERHEKESALQRAEQERHRNERLIAQLQALGIKPQL